MQELADQLRELGFDVDMGFAQHNVVVVNNYEIKAGPHSGRRVRVGIPAQDFPFTAPAGLHFNPDQTGSTGVAACRTGRKVIATPAMCSRTSTRCC
jgi:hypothetical protein